MRLELDAEVNESSDEENLQCSSIQSFDVDLMLAKHLLLSPEERGEETAAEDRKLFQP